MKRLILSLLLLPQLPAQELRLGMSIGNNSVAGTCGPVSCQPQQLSGRVGQPVQLIAQGAPRAAHLLVVGPSQAVCSPVPGIRGRLIAIPLFVGPVQLTWGKIHITGPTPACPPTSWMGFARIPTPSTLPSGSGFVVQLASSVWTGTQLQPTLSNAVALQLR